MGEIGHQHIQAPLAAAISPLAISPRTWLNEMSPDHNTGSFTPYSLRIVCGFFYVPLGCEYLRVVRRGLRFIVLIREDLKVLTICGCNYKGSTFSSVILRPWGLVRPESNSRPPAWQPDAQSTDHTIVQLEPLLSVISEASLATNLPFHWRIALSQGQTTSVFTMYSSTCVYSSFTSWQSVFSIRQRFLWGQSGG